MALARQEWRTPDQSRMVGNRYGNLYGTDSLVAQSPWTSPKRVTPTSLAQRSTVGLEAPSSLGAPLRVLVRQLGVPPVEILGDARIQSIVGQRVLEELRRQLRA
jgi:hypothetical protein